MLRIGLIKLYKIESYSLSASRVHKYNVDYKNILKILILFLNFIKI